MIIKKTRKPNRFQLSARLITVLVLMLVCAGIMLNAVLTGVASAGLIYLLVVCAVFIAVLMVWKIFLPIYRTEKILLDISAHSSEDISFKSNRLPLDRVVEVLVLEQIELNNKKLKTEYLKKEAELRALQGQINPHFLYNTLETIRGLAVIQDAADIADMTETLAAMFRANMRKSDTLVTLSEEIENVERYMFIQKFRFNDKFIFYKHIPDYDEVLQCKIPNLTLQPIVENAVHHGLETLKGGGEIHLHCYRTVKRTIIKISDNGCGIPAGILNEINNNLDEDTSFISPAARKDQPYYPNTGIALSNINQRIKMLFGEEYGLHIFSTPGVGTDVEITLPYFIDAYKKADI